MKSETSLLPYHACTTLRSGYSYANTMELLHDAAWATQTLAEIYTPKQHEQLFGVH